MTTYENMIILDNVTGKIPGLKAELTEGDTLRFSVDDSSKRATSLNDIPKTKSDLFLEFAHLGNESQKAFEKYKKKEEGGIVSAKTKKDFYIEKILSFAKMYGPLFGYAGFSDKPEPHINEPLKDWTDAQRMMERILLIDIFVERQEVSDTEIAKWFPIGTRNQGGIFEWHYQFVPEIKPSGLYKNMLRKELNISYTTGDFSGITAYWTPESDYGCVADLVLGYPTRIDLPVRAVTLKEAMEYRENVAELPSLLKIVSQAHTTGMYLGYKNLYSATASKREGAYRILSDNLLSWMWHSLSLSYAREAFSVCANPRCKNIIVLNEDAKISRKFCSDKCRAQVNNAKLTEQERRARESFYQGKDSEAIYRDAFEIDASEDPDAEKHLERLHRWVNKWSKTKKGKQQIAARNQNKKSS